MVLPASNGAMATNTMVIDGRQIGADGVWITAEGRGGTGQYYRPVHAISGAEPVGRPFHQGIQYHYIGRKHPPASAGIMPSV